jgi:hypothetical protein
VMTHATLASAALEEATAIVEAEWIRLAQESQRADDITEIHAELPAPRVLTPAVRTQTTTLDRSGCAVIRSQGRLPTSWVNLRVWATQRSPPKAALSHEQTARPRWR